MSDVKTRPYKAPPRWFMHTFWRVHRALYRLSGGRFLWTPAGKRGWGALHLTTIGRKSSLERSVIVGYLEDGPNLVTLAMNGGEEGHPAWWLNLEAHPDAVVRLSRQEPRPVRARRHRPRARPTVAAMGIGRPRQRGRRPPVDRDTRGHPRPTRRFATSTDSRAREADVMSVAAGRTVTAHRSTMRAVVQRRYGPPDVLEQADVAAPVPGDGDVLVRVRAASVQTRATTTF